MCFALSEGDEWETLIRHPAVLYSLSGLVMSCPLMNRNYAFAGALLFFIMGFVWAGLRFLGLGHKCASRIVWVVGFLSSRFTIHAPFLFLTPPLPNVFVID